ncbi:TPA: hypothetical protein DEG21_03465 [Patescibacteria group bacterium]|nr:hypothetical protein [Candidatus Gracilibacteria bacterium]
MQEGKYCGFEDLWCGREYYFPVALQVALIFASVMPSHIDFIFPGEVIFSSQFLRSSLFCIF